MLLQEQARSWLPEPVLASLPALLLPVLVLAWRPVLLPLELLL